MNQETVERRIDQLLRETALNGSDRDVSLEATLGESGVGLDSLALVQFLVALEKEFRIRIPLDFWSRADQVSLRDCVVLILDAPDNG